jgi:excisionase family DNA binding protein
MNNLSQTVSDFSLGRNPTGSIWNSCEAAQYLRISPRTLTRMARRGEIPSIQIGRLWRFRRADLDEWLTRKVNLVSYPCRLNS